MKKLRFKSVAAVGLALALLAAAPVLAGIWGSAPPQVHEAYDPLVVRDIQLTIDPGDWDTIRFDVSNSIEVPADLWIDGEGPLLVSVRRKSSRALPSEEDPRKVGLKVDISGLVSGQRWKGVSKLSLENGGDVSPVAEGLAWLLHQRASIDGGYGEGYDPALAAWANVSVNGELLGLYTSVEQRNKQFLRNRDLFVEGQVWFYEQDDISSVGLEVGEGNSPTYELLCYAPFQNLGKKKGGCSTPTDAQLTEQLSTLINMQAMLTQGAVDAFLVNPDALFTKGKNHFYLDSTFAPRRYYPWDLDAVFRSRTENVYSAGSSQRQGVTTYTQAPFQELILNNPDFREQYNQILTTLVGGDGPLSAGALRDLLNELEDVLTASIEADPHIGAVVSESPAEHFEWFRTWTAERAAEVLRQVAANLPPPR